MQVRPITIAIIPAMATARAAHTATSLGDGRVLIAGGFADGSPATRTTELYDARAARFMTGPPMGTARQSHSATKLADGRILVAGGMSGGEYLASTEIFDPRTGRFQPAAPMREARSSTRTTC